MKTIKNKYLLILTGILFTFSIMCTYIYDMTILYTRIGTTSSLIYSTVKAAFYIPVLLYCFFLYRIKHGHILYFITFGYYIVSSLYSTFYTFEQFLEYSLKFNVYLSLVFNLIPIIAKLLMIFAAYIKSKIFAFVIFFLSVIACFASVITLIFYFAFYIFGDGTLDYIIYLFSVFLLELASILFSAELVYEAFKKTSPLTINQN